MNKVLTSALILFVLFVVPLHCQETEMTGEPAENKTKNILLPSFSYKYISFNDFKFHNISSSLSLIRINPADRNNMFVLSMMYSPQYASKIDPAFPDFYQNIALSAMQKNGRHLFNLSFIAMTDKPLYGGTKTFMGMGGYSYNAVKGEHFSLNIGAILLFMDVGYEFDNGTKWYLWPVPMLSFSWTYDWIVFGFMPESGFIPNARATIGPKHPFSLILKAGFGSYDGSLWYRYFKNGNADSELTAIGAGFKDEKSSVRLSDGSSYGVNYYALYGSLRLLKFIEFSGGWMFNGKDEYKKTTWNSIFGSMNSSSKSKKSGNDVENGYYLSVSFKVSM